MRVWNAPSLIGFVLIFAACGPAPSPILQTAVPTPEIIVTPAATVETALPTRITPTREITLNATRPLTLTVWTPEEFAPGAERGGDVLQARMAAFEAAHPDIRINHVLRAPYGKGGIVDWIAQLHELMPDRLPDAAIVDSRELDRLEELGLLQPLNRALPSGAYWDLFPPAQKIARRGGVWNNQPLVLDFELLAYDTRRITAPPLTWQDVLTTTTQFAFAADSTDTFLLHYFHDGGSLSPSEHPALDSGIMQAILEYFQRARANGNLNEAAASMKSAREILPLFVAGQTPLAQVRARDFLSERARLADAAAASVPTRDGRATTLASAWSLVVLTPVPERRHAAEAFLAFLNEPAFLGEWTQAARLTPASKSAFAQTLAAETFGDMFANLLDDAMVAPGFSAQAPYADAWHAAVQAVLSGQLAPDDAAYRALQRVTQ